MTLSKLIKELGIAADPTEAAYARSDLFERRRRLMDDWASAIETR